MSTPADAGFLPPHGNYAALRSFQKAEVVYDLTFRFAHKFLSRGDRTVDQMIQSARSGKKNLLEGSKAALTSKETELKLTNVGRASLEELLDDYKDYLRARDLPLWDKDSKEARYVRRLGRRTPQTYELYRQFVETRPPAVIANMAICLIHQANYLIDQQLRRLEKDFLEQGGLRERMTRARLAYRNQPPATVSHLPAPSVPPTTPHSQRRVRGEAAAPNGIPHPSHSSPPVPGRRSAEQPPGLP